MTENEAIEALKLEGGLEITGRPIRVAQFFEGIDEAIQALEDVQKYRQICAAEVLEWATKLANLAKKCGTIGKVIDECAEYEEIGTVEEFRAAVEKQTAKQPDYEGDGYADGQLVYDTWICPCCGKYYEVGDSYDYCPNCGQRLDWSDDDGKTD